MISLFVVGPSKSVSDFVFKHSLSASIVRKYLDLGSYNFTGLGVGIKPRRGHVLNVKGVIGDGDENLPMLRGHTHRVGISSHGTELIAMALPIT
tara:strand:+ start:683 stop:964 length:282 start_codon:yes stop_codon:yes gene_type:complete